jgi:hypothetical protein
MLNEHLVAQIEQIATGSCDLETSKKVASKVRELLKEEELRQLARTLYYPDEYCSHMFPSLIAGIYATLVMLEKRTDPQLTELDRLWKL